MIPDQLAIVRTIAESPDDDTPRLIYCDWLEENGYDERAEFIRLQLEMARLEAGDPISKVLKHRVDRLILTRVQQWREAELPQYPRVAWGDYERGFVHELTIYGEEGLRAFVWHQDDLLSIAPIIRLSFNRCLELPPRGYWSRFGPMPLVRTIGFDPYWGNVNPEAFREMAESGLFHFVQNLDLGSSRIDMEQLCYFLDRARPAFLEKLNLGFTRIPPDDLRVLPGWKNCPRLRTIHVRGEIYHGAQLQALLADSN